MQDPAEDDILKGRAAEEIIQQMADVVQYHRLGLFRDLKGVHIPAPIAVQEYAVG